MPSTISSNQIDKVSSKKVLTSHHRKLKGFYAKILAYMLRKTEADKRIGLFGKDPFK